MLLQLHAAILVILAATMVADLEVVWAVCSVVVGVVADAAQLLIADATLHLRLTADVKLILAAAETSCSTVEFEAEFRACALEFAACLLAADVSHLADANHPADAKPLQLLAATK